jgi:pimeloyl-ACP methyl ester carboxylesterase
MVIYNNKFSSGKMRQARESLDISFSEGGTSRPLVIFIHGLGMDKNIWVGPEKSRILAGNFPLTVLLGKKPRTRVFYHKPQHYKKTTTGPPPIHLITLFRLLREKGFSVLAWSQKRPFARAVMALEELLEITNNYRHFSQNGLILVGHSRGGLVARNYALRYPENVRALITMGTPFRGSTLAKWAGLASKSLSFLQPLLRKSDGGSVRKTMKRVNDFIQSKAVEELLPDSDFLKSLKKHLKSNIKTLCIAGTNPNFLHVYKWREKCVKTNGNTNKYYLVPKLIFSFPDSLHGIMPDELCKGKGDGLVAQVSAISEDCNDAGVYPLNHVQMLFSEAVHDKAQAFLKELERNP